MPSCVLCLCARACAERWHVEVCVNMYAHTGWSVYASACMRTCESARLYVYVNEIVGICEDGML